jgi:2,4-dienoyl-CoA reductase-like NADH-dependent reductase (Old Yellow Enzyme family)
MRRASFAATVRRALVVAAVVVAGSGSARAQTQSPAPQQAAAAMPRDEITAFAKVHLAVAQARDSIQLQLAQPGNKKPEAQKQLQEKLQI